MTRTLPCLLLLFCCTRLEAAEFRSRWPKGVERPWTGPEYWANPLQDWRIRDGRLQCVAPGGDRNVYLLTRHVTGQPGTLEMSVRLGRLQPAGAAASGKTAAPPAAKRQQRAAGTGNEGFVGFRFGIRGAFNDYRDSAVRGLGVNAGIAADGRLFIGRLDESAPRVILPVSDVELRLRAEPVAGASSGTYRVTLAAFDPSGTRLAEAERTDIPAKWVAGGVALVCSSGPVEETPGEDPSNVDPGWGGKRGTQRGGSMRFWFADWKVSGTKVATHDERAFGPILFALHTLSRKVLKLTAQLAPVDDPNGQVRLEIRDGNRAAASARWRAVAAAAIDPLARTATFRVAVWNDSRNTTYRLVYSPRAGADSREYVFEGTIRPDPATKPRIVVAAFTGNNDFGFPHADIVRHVKVHRPDLLVYTGDQIYERVGEYGIERRPLATAVLDYLRKWYIFGWEYRDLLRDIPAVCLPDDHDVYHGNLWGAGGRHAEGEPPVGPDKGGYIMPAEFVNAVQRTQTSHMADPYDPTPVDQGISVYYGPMLYGGVSFAVIEDRKWKSAPKEVVPAAEIVNGWPQNEKYVAARDGDAPGAQLLGPRQMEFLEKWAADWSGGAWMKAVISQSLFATVATLPRGERNDSGVQNLKIFPPGEYPETDLPTQDHDSNGWPQTPRTNALRLMRSCAAFHISGDQHLGSTVQYGIDGWNDGPWAICVPSVANVFPRRWFPSTPGAKRRPGAPRYTGEFFDGFGNRVTVHAVSNPHRVAAEPKSIHMRAPGYGIVTFDRATRNITIANWPRSVNPAKPGATPYPGWPITIHQLENGLLHKGESRWRLPEVRSATPNPVVQVIDQANNEIVYTVRIAGTSFRPPVLRDGLYTVKLGDGNGGAEKELRDLRPTGRAAGR